MNTQANNTQERLHVMKGDTFGKLRAGEFVSYEVMRVFADGDTVILRQVDSYLADFETSVAKLLKSGYERLDPTPIEDNPAPAAEAAPAIVEEAPAATETNAAQATAEVPAAIEAEAEIEPFFHPDPVVCALVNACRQVPCLMV